MKPNVGARINFAHPLARGLVGCWLFNEGGGSRVFDLSGRNNQGYFLGSPTRVGDALNLTPTDSVEIPQRSQINNLPQFSVAIRTRVSASGIGAFVFNKGGGLQATSGQLIFGQFNLQIDVAHSTTTASSRSDNLTNFLGTTGLVCFTFDGVNAPRIFWLGSEVPYGLSTAPSGTRTADNTFNLRFNRNHFSSQGVTARHNYALFFNRALAPAEVRALSDNPYAFIRQPEPVLGFVASAAVELSGSASGSATVSGALTVGKNLSGQAAGTSTGSGALSVGKPLSGSSAGTSTATGALSVTKTLAGSAAGSATVTASLSTGSGLSGSTSGSATVSGSLSVTKSLGGSSEGTSTVTGAVSVTKQLSGTSNGIATVTASLSTDELAPQTPSWLVFPLATQFQGNELRSSLTTNELKTVN